MKNSTAVFYLPFIIFCVFSCQKKQESTPKVNTGYKIQLVSGNNQTDTTGKTLKDILLFKVTADDSAVKKGYIRFERYNCDLELQKEESPLPAGTLSVPYMWTLSGIVGTQTLKVILSDSFNVARDSVVVNATAIEAKQGWHVSGCVPANTFAVSFCSLPSGRIITAFNQIDFPYYSDDKGVTWHTLRTLPGKYKITKLIATPQNEIFLAVAYDGMFYSPDGGQTWERRNSGLPISQFWGNIQYTRSGKMFVLTGDGVYASNDKGVTWGKSMAGLFYYAGFSDACSMSDGSILAVHNNQLYHSNDGGNSWGEVWSMSRRITALFIDDNDDIYVGTFGSSNNSDGIYVSKNNTQTWSKVFTPTVASGYDATISIITKQNSSYYFYSTSQNILMKTTDFINYTKVQPPVGVNNGRLSNRYIAPDANRWIISTESYGLYYFIP